MSDQLNPEKKEFCDRVLPSRAEVTMSEVEFDRLLDVVRTAVAPISGEDSTPSHLTISNARPQAANDNGSAWPLIPFPDGWNAAC